MALADRLEEPPPLAVVIGQHGQVAVLGGVGPARATGCVHSRARWSADRRSRLACAHTARTAPSSRTSALRSSGRRCAPWPAGRRAGRWPPPCRGCGRSPPSDEARLARRALQQHRDRRRGLDQVVIGRPPGVAAAAAVADHAEIDDRVVGLADGLAADLAPPLGGAVDGCSRRTRPRRQPAAGSRRAPRFFRSSTSERLPLALC